MPARRLVGECEGGTCATLYAVDGTGDLLVQGYNTSETETAGIDVPAGESVVRIPAHIIERYAREYLNG
ncbi:hypothetical protein [Streptomyces rimosus]|uniref:hypothetical protein n=1 Tax=Streptomyces rimosus TaxID=1927 RepID=UPI0004CAEB21|nr:hypothetical protein [Streptomyces rimosus]